MCSLLIDCLEHVGLRNLRQGPVRGTLSHSLIRQIAAGLRKADALGWQVPPKRAFGQNRALVYPEALRCLEPKAAIGKIAPQRIGRGGFFCERDVGVRPEQIEGVSGETSFPVMRSP